MKNNKFLSFLLSFLFITSCSILDDEKEYSNKYTGDSSYTISWIDGNGDLLYDERVKKGDTPTYDNSKKTPTKNETSQYYYTFNDTWEPEIVPASKNTSYYAQFDSTIRNYKITFYDYLSASYDVICNYGTTPKPPEAASRNYSQGDYNFIFDRWEPEIKEVTGSMIYRPKYNRVLSSDLYKVTFVLDNGEDNIEYYFSEGATITYPSNPKKEGYAFIGWDSDIQIMPSYDLTIKATYDEQIGLFYTINDESLFKTFDSLVNENYITLGNNKKTIISNNLNNIGSNINGILYVPTSISSIGANAFNGCNNLKEIIILGNVTSIGSQAFANCINLTRFALYGSSNTTFANGNTDFGTTNYGNTTYYADIQDPSNYLNYFVFHGCYSLTYFELYNSQTTFSNIIFGNSINNVSTILFPKTIKNVTVYYSLYENLWRASLSSLIFYDSFETLRLFYDNRYDNLLNPNLPVYLYLYYTKTATDWNKLSINYFMRDYNTSVTNPTYSPKYYRYLMTSTKQPSYIIFSPGYK